MTDVRGLQTWRRWYRGQRALEDTYNALMKRVLDENIPDHVALRAAQEAERLEDMMLAGRSERAFAEAILALARAVDRLASALRDEVNGEEDRTLVWEKAHEAAVIAEAIMSVEEDQK